MRIALHSPLPENIYVLVWRRTLPLQVAVLALGLLTPFLTVVPLDLQRRIVDEAIPAGNLGMLALLALGYAAVALASAVLKFVIYILRGVIEARMTRYLRARAIQAQRGRDDAAGRAALGPVASVIAEEAYPLGGFAAEAINTPVIEISTMLTVAGFLFVTDPRLALIGVGAIAAQAVVVPVVQRVINRITRNRIVAERAATGATVAATMHDPGAHFSAALAASRDAYRLRMRMNVWKAALKSGLRFSDNLAIMLVLGIGGALVVEGETTLGVLVAFLSGLKRLNDPWQTLIAFYRDFADAQVKYDLVRAAIAPRVPVPGQAPVAAPAPAAVAVNPPA